jgi:hypothetical protein
MVRETERSPQQNVSNAFQCAICEGCQRPFVPSRKDARHCRPSCRVLSMQRRRQQPPTARAADWRLFE